MTGTASAARPGPSPSGTGAPRNAYDREDSEMQYLTTADVAERFRTVEGTVRYWRHIGYGPRGVKVGRRVLYTSTEIARFEADLMSGAEIEPPDAPEAPDEDDQIAALTADRDQWQARALAAEKKVKTITRALKGIAE